MAKYKKQRKVVGSKNLVTKAIPKELEQIITKKQKELQAKENARRKKKNKIISFAWAGYELALEMEGK